MWIVTKIGFFNIVCQDKELITVKARSRDDLVKLEDYIPFDLEIEESDAADYKFRRKATRANVAAGIRQLVKEIDYPMTKPAITQWFPERREIYLNVWGDLLRIQEPDV